MCNYLIHVPSNVGFRTCMWLSTTNVFFLASGDWEMNSKHSMARYHSCDHYFHPTHLLWHWQPTLLSDIFARNLLMSSLNTRFKCSFCKSSGTFSPSPPFGLHVQFHTNLWAICGVRVTFTWARRLKASTAYLVCLSALKCSMKNFQQRINLSPSPWWLASLKFCTSRPNPIIEQKHHQCRLCSHHQGFEHADGQILWWALLNTGKGTSFSHHL